MSTMTLPVFNPFAFANKLKDAGVPPAQAEAEAEVLHEALLQQAQAVSALEQRFSTQETLSKKDAQQMASKADLNAVHTALKSDLNAVYTELKSDLNAVYTELKGDIAVLKGEIKLLHWMLGFVLAGIAALVLKAFF